jgi:hypothetical protein
VDKHSFIHDYNLLSILYLDFSHPLYFRIIIAEVVRDFLCTRTLNQTKYETDTSIVVRLQHNAKLRSVHVCIHKIESSAAAAAKGFVDVKDCGYCPLEISLLPLLPVSFPFGLLLPLQYLYLF